jgi:hypothetical protein
MKLSALAKSILNILLRAAGDSVPAAASSSAAVLSACAVCGAAENRNALAPINDIAHIFYGDEASEAASSTCSARNLLRYTLPAIAWNTFALWGWAIGHRLLVGRSQSQARSLAAGAAVSLVAYVIDYKLVPPRWTPGIEAHLSKRSLFVAYVALALGLAFAPRPRGE